MLKLTRLKIDKYRNVKPGTELRFSNGFNVLLGQNGTGKTTLLELISMVVRSDFSSLAREEFAIEYEFDLPGQCTVRFRNSRVSGLPAEFSARELMLGQREPLQPFVEIEWTSTPPETRHSLQYDLENGLIRNGSKVEPGGPMYPFEPGFGSTLHALWANTPGEQLMRSVSAYRFDESLDLFRKIVSSKEFPGDLWFLPRVDALNVPLLLPMPASITWAIHSKLTDRSAERDFAFSHEKFDFLTTLVRIMGFAAAELKVEVIERQVMEAGGLERIRLGNMIFRFDMEGGNFITHDSLSYGQKRLLTFYYYLACNEDIVIADELVNGLHHQWIIACVDAIGKHQAFLTSQNPLLLDYLPFSSAEQVRSSFVLCRSEKHDNRPCMVWENMSEQDAAEFFSAYEIGVEHVSEILQSRGLW
jgi:energy-coupling factor transporter ATP-binding protein EcfA2